MIEMIKCWLLLPYTIYVELTELNGRLKDIRNEIAAASAQQAITNNEISAIKLTLESCTTKENHRKTKCFVTGHWND